MEKTAIIAPGVTPPEEPRQKQASAEGLEQHTSKRLADAAENKMAAWAAKADQAARQP